MTGAVMALAAGGSVPASGTVHVSPLPAWTGLYGVDTVSTNTVTLSGPGATISLSAGLSGGGLLFYSLNAGFAAYTGAFAYHPADTLSWTVVNNNSTRVSGNLTVLNVTDSSATLATVPYSIGGS